MILYASYGEGHIQVSRALQQSLEQRGAEVCLVDLFKVSHPILDKLTGFFYINSYRMLPQIYGWLYYGTKRMRHDTWLSRRLHSIGISTLKRIIADERPDAVINTFPLLAMPQLRETTGTAIPTYTVITDFVLHNRWVHGHIDKYYVPTEDIKKEIARQGIPRARIRVSGIPLKKNFGDEDLPPDLYKKYGLDPAGKTVLIMAGSYGVLTGFKRICQQLSRQPGVQVIAVCGHNGELRDSLRKAFAGSPQVRILGYAQEINELMSVASCLVTKPGGITLSEALSANLPMVLYRPVPGQERDNAVFLAGKGAAVIAETTRGLVRQIGDLLVNERKRAAMRRAALALGKPQATETVVEDLINDLETGNIVYRLQRQARKVIPFTPRAQ